MPKLKTGPEKVKLHDGTEIEVLRTNGAGRIPYLADDGTEQAGDLIEVLTKLKGGLDERGGLESRAKAAEDALNPYKSLGSVEDLQKALDMTRELTAGDLKTVEDVRKLQEEAALKERGQWEEKLKAAAAETERLKTQIEQADLLQVCHKVAGLKKKDAMGKEIPVFAAPGEGLHQIFRDHARRDEKGKWQFSRTAGRFDSSDIILHEYNPAPPEIAFQELAKTQPWLLHKPTGNGSGHGNDGGGGGGLGSTMPRSEYLKLNQSNPGKAREFTQAGGRIVDDAAA